MKIKGVFPKQMHQHKQAMVFPSPNTLYYLQVLMFLQEIKESRRCFIFQLYSDTLSDRRF